MSAPNSNEALRRVAAAVIDNEAIDWEQMTLPDEVAQRKVHNLRLIQSIGEAHQVARDELVDTATIEPQSRPTWGKLQLLQRVGAGSFGEVYRAWDPDLQCEVALKLPSSMAMAGTDPCRRFLHEARQLAKVKHEHVLRVLGADTYDGRVGIWTELIEGRTLEELLRHSGRFSAEEATSIGIELCRALAAVHRAGILHRDVKTANVVREEGGRIVLLDFSTAAPPLLAAEGPDSRTPLSGTPRFMAPEQFHGNPASARTDIYALGVLLYRLVTVNYPVDATTLEELAQHHLTGEFIPLRDKRPDLPGPFVQVVERALSARPERRYGSAGEMEQALETTRGSRTTTVDIDGPQPPIPQRLKRFMMVSIAAVGLTAVIALAYNFWPRPLDVALTFHRLDASGIPRAVEENARLELGDLVYFQIKASRESYLYVISEDLEGHTRVMFPTADFDLSNPLEANRRYAIPGTSDGATEYWIVDTSSAVEAFMVVAADRPLMDLENIIAGLQPVELDREIVLRGFGRAPAPDTKPDGIRILPDLAADLAVLADSDQGVWYREYRFRGTRVE